MLGLLGISGFSLYSFNQTREKLNAYIGDSVTLSLIIGRIEAYDREEEALLNRVFEENAQGKHLDLRLIQVRKQSFERLYNQIQQQYDQLIRLSKNEMAHYHQDLVQKAYAQLIDVAELTQKNYISYVQLMRKSFSLVESHQTNLAKQLFSDLENTDDRIGRLTKQIGQIRDLIMDTAHADLIDTNHLIRIYLAATSLILLLLSFLILSIARDVLIPLNRAIKSTQAIRQGARTLSIPQNISPEFLRLFEAIEKMLDTLRLNEQDAKEKAAQLESFASTAAHDLKSPLNTIVGYADLLESRLREKEKNGEELLWATRLKNSSTQMGHLIDDLLSYSRTSAVDAKMEDVDLNTVYEKVVSDLQVSFHAAGARIQSTSLPVVRGNALLLYQVFLNVLENALKYRSSKNPEIEVSAVTDKESATLRISDNGIGIPKEMQTKVFEIFQRGSAPKNVPGTGIGLATVKRIIEKHGGKVWIQSEPGEGTTLSLTLSLAQTHPFPAEPFAQEKRGF
jgi:signal transduction histidine kinase